MVEQPGWREDRGADGSIVGAAAESGNAYCGAYGANLNTPAVRLDVAEQADPRILGPVVSPISPVLGESEGGDGPEVDLSEVRCGDLGDRSACASDQKGDTGGA